jgi:RNA polymerase sigma-70 factor (ECF subfamily)
MVETTPERTDRTTGDLVRAALAGDLESFGRLVERYEARVRAVALAGGLDPAEAEDAAQDAFTAAHAELPSLRDPDSFPSWVLSIARRRASTRRRRQEATPRPHGDLGALGIVDPREGPAETAEREAAREDVRRALSDLDDRSRLAFSLRHHAGLTYEEIADALTVPVTTVKGILYRGTLLLRSRLAGEAGARRAP